MTAVSTCLHSPVHSFTYARLAASLLPRELPCAGSSKHCAAAPFQSFLPDTGLCFAIHAEQRQVSPCTCRHKNATATAKAVLRGAFILTQMQQQQSPNERALLETCVLLPNQLSSSLTFCTVMTASWVLLSVVTLNISTPSSSFTRYVMSVFSPTSESSAFTLPIVVPTGAVSTMLN